MTDRERALVLGGGGASGNAWTIGVIAGLFDAGVDVTDADTIIGTSAGATTAAQICATKPPDLYAAILAAVPPTRRASSAPEQSSAANRPVPNHMEVTAAIIAASADPADMRRRMGAWVLERSAASGDAAQAQWRTTVSARLPNQDWSQRALLITAVNADSGEPVVFDRNSGVDLVDAVAASTAGGFAYTIGGTRYYDGGYRANENVDLAAGYARVLVLSPLGGRSRHPMEWGTRLDAQVAELRAQGSRVDAILPDSNSQAAMGSGLGIMDLSTRRPSAEAGYTQGKTLAERLGDFWR